MTTQEQAEQDQDRALEPWELTEEEVDALAETYRAEWLIAEEGGG